MKKIALALFLALVAVIGIGVYKTDGYTGGLDYSAYYERGTHAKDLRGPRQFPMKMRLQKYAEQNGICVHCKGVFKFSEMQGDHIIPWSKGGKTVYSNLQMLCIKCNHKKGNRFSY